MKYSRLELSQKNDAILIFLDVPATIAAMVYVEYPRTEEAAAAPEFQPAKKRKEFQIAPPPPKRGNRSVMMRWFLYGSLVAIVVFVVSLYFVWMKLTTFL